MNRNTKLSIVLAAGCAAVSAGPALSHAQVPTDETDAQTEQFEEVEETATVNAANRIVCRRIPGAPGTRVSTRRVCKTQMQWDRIRRDTQDILQRAQMNRW